MKPRTMAITVQKPKKTVPSYVN